MITKLSSFQEQESALCLSVKDWLTGKMALYCIVYMDMNRQRRFYTHMMKECDSGSDSTYVIGPHRHHGMRSAVANWQALDNIMAQMGWWVQIVDGTKLVDLSTGALIYIHILSMFAKLVGEGFDKTEGDSDLPIDIPYSKIVEWVVRGGNGLT